LNLVPTWPDQFDQALAIYFHSSTLWQHEKTIVQLFDNMKKPKILPFYPKDGGAEAFGVHSSQELEPHNH